MNPDSNCGEPPREDDPVSMELSEIVSPAHTALVLQELQNGVVGEGSALPALADAAREVGIAQAAQRLADAAREAGVPVIHATAENLAGSFGANTNARLFAAAKRAGALNVHGDDAVKPLAELFAEGDHVLPRYHGLSPLHGTQLDALFRNEGITTLVVAGVSLNVAIPNLVFDAVNRGYQVVLVRDAVAGTPVAFGDQIIDNSLAFISTVVTAAELETQWMP